MRHAIVSDLTSNNFDLAPNDIHVWFVSLSDRTICQDSCFSLLSVPEQTRAKKFKFDKDRQLFIVAHAAMRSILAQFLNLLPADVDFATGINGKPRLATDVFGDLRFNLSHSGNSAVIAAAWSREIGVDIELVKEEFAYDEVAERLFTAREVTALRALPTHLQREAFYKCWTSKEAFLKAKGTGLSGVLDEVEIILSSDDHVRIDARVAGWSLAEINPSGGYMAALASEGAPVETHLYRWRP